MKDEKVLQSLSTFAVRLQGWGFTSYFHSVPYIFSPSLPQFAPEALVSSNAKKDTELPPIAPLNNQQWVIWWVCVIDKQSVQGVPYAVWERFLASP